MQTTYAVSLLAPDSSEKDRITAVDLWSDWLAENYRTDTRPPGLSVRVRERSDDPVFRITVNKAETDVTNVLTATIALIDGNLLFDVRNVTFPTISKVVPSRSFIPQRSVIDTVRKTLAEIVIEDANVRVSNTARQLSTELHGQEVGALIHAPSRRLPIVVEVHDFERGTPPLFGKQVGPLVGLAHLVSITDPAALTGFSDMSGLSLITPGSIHVCWAGSMEPHRFDVPLPQVSRVSVFETLVETIVSSAALSLPLPRLPSPPRDELPVETFSPQRITSSSSGYSEEEWIEALDESEQRVEQLESRVMELEASLTSADLIIDRQNKLKDHLIAEKTALEIQLSQAPADVNIKTVKQAVDFAQLHSSFLVFHERAIESGHALQAADPIAIVKALAALDRVAHKWLMGDITNTSIAATCKAEGLDFAAGVSDTAVNKYGTDYQIEWNGRPVLAEAHVRVGQGSNHARIHVYFDHDTHRVVVAYIGRHLRDKGSGS
jgi:hypothetical protein